MTDKVTHGTISHAQLGCMQQIDPCHKCMDIQNTPDEHMNHQNAHDKCTNTQNTCDKCMNGSNPHTTHSINQSNEPACNMNMHDDETTNKQYETHTTIKLHVQKQSWQNSNVM